MKHRSIRIALAAATVVLGVAAAPVQAQQMPAWEAQLYEAAKKEKEFTVYTAHYNTEEASRLCTAFETRYPGVKCNFVRTTAQVAFQRLQQDMMAKVAVASVFSSTDVSHYPALKKKGQLLAYRPHNLDKVVDSLKQYSDPEGYYTVTAAALMLITYNTELVPQAEAPEELARPAEPEMEGQGLHRPSRFQRLRRHLGGTDAEALRLGLLRETREELARRSAARSTIPSPCSMRRSVGWRPAPKQRRC